MQRYFNKRLKATYYRFSGIPNPSMVCGLHHVYFVDTKGIYRMDKRKKEQDPEQVLDLGQFSEWDGSERKQLLQCIVQRIRLSPTEKHLAATLKTFHKEERRCVIIKLGQDTFSSADQPHVILTLDKVFSFEWAKDEVLFYTTLEDLRSSRVFCLDITKKQDKIRSVFEESELDVFVEVALTRDQRVLTINCNSRTSSEVLLIDKEAPSLEPRLIQKRKSNLLYHIEHWKDWLIILTNTGPGHEYQVVQAPLSDSSMDSWVPLFVPPPGITIKDMEVIEDFCVLTARTPANEYLLTVIPLKQPKDVYYLELPSWACAVETKKTGVADKNNTLEFFISSPIHPPVSHCLYPKDGLLLSAEENSSELQNGLITSRLKACSNDGTLVPITLFHAAHVKCLEKVPLLVHVYGSYGRDINMEFCPKKRLLLEQGWALAYCHIRGGGECGLSWYRQACVEGKPRGVEDLLACLQYLFSSGVSTSSLTALTACSAGAVPVGALCNRHPHLMKAVTLQAPFLDVLATMENTSMPLNIEDREEWGDPVGNAAHRLAIVSYCPLQNITPQRYPSMLLTAYKGDARVPLAGIVKYTEKLQDAIQTHLSTNPTSESEQAPKIVLNIQPGENHHGQEDFDLMVEEAALKLAFLHTELRLDRPRRSRTKKR